MTERAVLYARVSSDDSRKDGRNLAGQLDMCRAYATEQGYSIIAELHEDDRGASGASFELLQLKRVREMAQAGEFDVLVCREIDRLSRSLAKQLIVEEELRRAGVQIAYVLGEYPDSPEGRLNKHIKATIAEYEREQIAERMTRGRLLKVSSGSILAHGHRPFGYNVVKVGGKWELEINDAEAPYVRLAFEWYARGDGERGPLSLREVARKLSELNVPTISDTMQGYAKARGRGEWGKATVQRMLGNETYNGVWRYGKVNGGEGDDLLTVAVPPIISRELWTTVQAKRADNRQNARRKPKYNYLMARRLTCGSCGARVPGFPSHSVTSKKVNLNYQCRATRDEYVRECKLQKSFKAGEVDAVVWGWVKTLLLDPAALAHGLEDYQDEQARRNAPLTERVKVIDSLLADNRAQLGRLLDLYLAGEFARELLTERKIKLEATIGALEREQVNLATHLKAQILTEEQIRTLQDFAGQVSTALAAAEANFAARRQLIEMLNVEGTLALEEDEKVVYVRCLLTGPDIGPDRLQLLSSSTATRRRRFARPPTRCADR